VAEALRILIVGGDSVIGSELRRRLLGIGQPVIATSRRPGPAFAAIALDLAADPASWSLPADLGAAVICAAITSDAACRDNPDLARRVNVTNTVSLARALARTGVRVVLLSTDLVSGEPPHAIPISGNLYAALKAEAENGVAACPGAAIIRLGKVLTQDQPLVSRWISDLRARRPIEAFDDRRLSPITLDFAADSIIAVARGREVGVVFATGRDVVDYYTFACALARAVGAPVEIVQAVSARARGLDAAAPASADANRRTSNPDLRSVAEALVCASCEGAGGIDACQQDAHQRS
jgi:dTDP-4-dehydrorhamnose reductase